MEQGTDLGDWRCLRILGKGSFGIVGLWKNMKNGQCTALKKFDVRTNSDSPGQIRVIMDMQDRWKKEVEMMYNQIDCEFIVKTVDVPDMLKVLSNNQQSRNSLWKELPILCMEYCSGGDLRQILKRPENISGLRESEVRRVLSHVGQAINYLHERNIIHRDLKPENILVQYYTKDSKVETVYKLSDLGFAKDLSNSDALCSTIVGTLQYLAPEVYMAKAYDRTVDFWSFGLIAFEITCGYRPFLHNESPAKWIPYVEQKAGDVICIYRPENKPDDVEYSITIPYNTHLTELFKKCLETWLRMMLQLDPNRRGRRIMVPNSPSTSIEDLSKQKDFQQIVGLTVLNNILSTRLLEIHCSFKRLAFAIGRSTKIIDIKNWICRDLKIEPINQLILTIDGTIVSDDDLTQKYYEKVDLFMIPKQQTSICPKLRIPKSINKFLTSWETIKDSATLRKVWMSTIYFLQTEVGQMETLKKSNDALKKAREQNYSRNLLPVKTDLEKAICSLEKVLEFEVELEEIDRNFGPNVSVPILVSSCTEKWGKDKDDLKSKYEDLLNLDEGILVLKPIRTSEIEDLYHRVLKGYDDWRERGGNLPIENLVKNVCHFIAQRDPTMDALNCNLVVQMKKLEADLQMQNQFKTIESTLSELMLTIVKSRCEKQTQLLHKAFGKMNINAVGHEENSTNFKEQYQPEFSERMSKSETYPLVEALTQNERETVSLDEQKLAKMTISKELEDLMQQSTYLDLEKEDIVTNTLNRANEILMAREELDWELL